MDRHLDRHHDTAQLLLSARRDPAQRLITLPTAIAPATEDQSYRIQRAVMRELGQIGGWKVGGPAPAGPYTCAPIPSRAIHPSPATADTLDRGIEAEIAVRLRTGLPTRETPYTHAEVVDAIESAHPAIETLQSRFVDPDAVDKLSNLADSLSNAGLVLGPAIPDWQSIALHGETVRIQADGQTIKTAPAPAAPGPRLPDFVAHLLVWLAGTGAGWAGGLRAGQVVTTGSWTGKDIIPQGATARIEFAHCGSAEVRFT